MTPQRGAALKTRAVALVLVGPPTSSSVGSLQNGFLAESVSCVQSRGSPFENGFRQESRHGHVGQIYDVAYAKIDRHAANYISLLA